MSRLAELKPHPFAVPEDVLDHLLTPALVIHMDKVRENLSRMRAYLDGQLLRWRPHLKTAKIPEVYTELVRLGVRQFKVATTREAQVMLEVLRSENVPGPDLMVAYPLVGPALRRLGDLAQLYPTVSVSALCEEPEVLAQFSSLLGVFVDVNPGMNRTGVPIEDESRILAIARSAGSRFRGIHCYEGHIHGGDAAFRRERCFEVYARATRLVHRLEFSGVRVGEIVTSGTPGFLHALAFEPWHRLPGTLHRVSPGTVVFHDFRSATEIEELDLVPAAVLATRIISRPAPGLVTCDAGSKSISAEQPEPCAFVLGHPDWTVQTPSEEHLPIRVPVDAEVRLGEVHYLVPYHVCPTVNLAEQALLLDHGSVTSRVSVSARAHELWV